MRLRWRWLLGLMIGLLPYSVAYGQVQPTITYPAGSYTLNFPSPVQIVTTGTSVTFTWVTPAPPSPNPTPTPVPPAPTPTPTVTGHAWVLALYDAAKPLTAAQQSALSSTTLKATALGLDMDWEPHPTTDPAVATWLSHVPTTPGLPVLMVITKDAGGAAKVDHVTGLPGDEAQITALIRKLRGGK